LKSLTYIDWIQNETIRAFGPTAAIFVRKATEDILIKDIPIIKGTALNYSNLSLHHDSRVYK